MSEFRATIGKTASFAILRPASTWPGAANGHSSRALQGVFELQLFVFVLFMDVFGSSGAAGAPAIKAARLRLPFTEGAVQSRGRGRRRVFP